MSSKRALVVDDSKSARAFLARILERHEITVDAAESAEAAIEYLARNKPDVIFMDHMMPGMDGFQAVQTIKNNPRTSTIPILMYTSQEGDLYLGQARALGAEGVLPKQIKQADVTRMLYQLQLVTDRRDREQTTFARVAQDMMKGSELLPANESAIIVPPIEDVPAIPVFISPGGEGADFTRLLPRMTLEIRAGVDASLQKELAALRGFIATSLDSHSERIHGDLAAALPAPASAPDIETPTMVPERRPWGAISGWTLALLAIAGAAFTSWMWWQQGSEIAALRTDLDAAYAEVETLRARPAVVSPPAVAPVPTDPAAVTPASDALPAGASPGTAAVELLPDGTVITGPPVDSPATPEVSPAPQATQPAAAAPVASLPTSQAQ